MKNKRIIIVEDQPIVALDFQTYLKMNGYYNSNYFITGKEAIENINELKPDLAILDIKLKDNISGLNIAEYLQSLDIPFIFVSAFSNPDNYQKAIALNPVKIFHKPIDHKSLLSTINKIFQIVSPI